MATYYVHGGLATGSNNGTTESNAWWTLADAMAGTGGTAPAAGDTVLCRGTDNITVKVESSAAGNTTTGPIKFIGVNSSWVNDGTRFVLHTGTTAIDAFQPKHSYLHLENLEFNSTSGAGSGIVAGSAGAANDCTLINCLARNQGSYGFNSGGTWMQRMRMIGCIAENNAATGFYRTRGTHLFCLARSNGGRGFESANGGTYIGCLSYSNTAVGMYIFGGCDLTNCVSHGNGSHGIETANGTCNLLGCRSTNNTGHNLVGHATNSFDTAVLGCYTQSGGAGEVLRIQNLSIHGATPSVIGGSDSGYGYADAAAGNFNLAATASMRRVPYDVISGVNIPYASAGLEPSDSAGGGGGASVPLIGPGGLVF